MTDPPPSLTPSPLSPCVFPSGVLTRIPLDPLGSLANALDNIRGVTRKRILVTVTGIVRLRLTLLHLHNSFPPPFQ